MTYAGCCFLVYDCDWCFVCCATPINTSTQAPYCVAYICLRSLLSGHHLWVSFCFIFRSLPQCLFSAWVLRSLLFSAYHSASLYFTSERRTCIWKYSNFGQGKCGKPHMEKLSFRAHYHRHLVCVCVKSAKSALYEVLLL